MAPQSSPARARGPRRRDPRLSTSFSIDSKDGRLDSVHPRLLVAIGLVWAMAFVACAPKANPSAETLARTMVAETIGAAPPTPTAGVTRSPTKGPPTASPTPASTPSLTPAPTDLPSVFTDDFSENRGDWADCRKCSWEQGELLMGPYAPALEQPDRLAICVPCGEHKFFRLAADVTLIQGQSDRGYGLMFWDTDQSLSMYEISPLFLVTVAARYDRPTRSFEILNPNVDQLLTGLVRPGKVPNHLEVAIQPAGADTATVYFKINGHTAFLLYNQPAEEGRVGLTIDSHAVEVGFDNFEFEVLEP